MGGGRIWELLEWMQNHQVAWRIYGAAVIDAVKAHESKAGLRAWGAVPSNVAYFFNRWQTRDMLWPIDARISSGHSTACHAACCNEGRQNYQRRSDGTAVKDESPDVEEYLDFVLGGLKKGPQYVGLDHQDIPKDSYFKENFRTWIKRLLHVPEWEETSNFPILTGSLNVGYETTHGKWKCALDSSSGLSLVEELETYCEPWCWPRDGDQLACLSGALLSSSEWTERPIDEADGPWIGDCYSSECPLAPGPYRALLSSGNGVVSIRVDDSSYCVFPSEQALMCELNVTQDSLDIIDPSKLHYTGLCTSLTCSSSSWYYPICC